MGRVLKTEVLTAFNTLLADIRTQVWLPTIGSGDAHQDENNSARSLAAIPLYMRGLFSMPTTEQPNELLGYPEAARFLSVSERTVQRWVRERRIPFLQLPERGSWSGGALRPVTTRKMVGAASGSPGPLTT